MAQLRKVGDGLRARFAQAAALLEEAAEDILAHRAGWRPLPQEWAFDHPGSAVVPIDRATDLLASDATRPALSARWSRSPEFPCILERER